MTDDIVTFIRARLGERANADWHARTCQTHQTMPPGTPFGLAGSPMSCNCGVPDLVEADVEVKRRIVEMHLGAHNCRDLVTGHYPADWPPFAPYGSPGAEWRHGTDEYFEQACLTARLLASEWSTHDAFQEAWRV